MGCVISKRTKKEPFITDNVLAMIEEIHKARAAGTLVTYTPEEAAKIINLQEEKKERARIKRL